MSRVLCLRWLFWISLQWVIVKADMCQPMGDCIVCSSLEQSVNAFCSKTGYKQLHICHSDAPTRSPLPAAVGLWRRQEGQNKSEPDVAAYKQWQSCTPPAQHDTASFFLFVFINMCMAFLSWFYILRRQRLKQLEQHVRIQSRIRGVRSI